jgi:hypothetical protein
MLLRPPKRYFRYQRPSRFSNWFAVPLCSTNVRQVDVLQFDQHHLDTQGSFCVDDVLDACVELLALAAKKTESTFMHP